MRMNLLITIMLVGVLLFVSCNFDNEYSVDLEKAVYGKSEIRNIKALLKTFPLNYSIDDAIQDGLFVIFENSIVGGGEKWIDFNSNVGVEKNDSIIVAIISNKGDMRLMYLSYVDNKFFCYFDMTRFKNSSIDYYSSNEYKFLKVYDIMGESNIVLVDNNFITYEEIGNDLANEIITSCYLFAFKNQE